MTQPLPKDLQSIPERLARIEELLEQLLRTQKAKRRGEKRRAATIARRVAAEVTYQPTDIERAAARRALRRLR